MGGADRIGEEGKECHTTSGDCHDVREDENQVPPGGVCTLGTLLPESSVTS